MVRVARSGVDFDVQVVNSVQEIGEKAWDHLGEGRPFTSYRWYRFGEVVMSDSTPVYIILSQGGEAVARATFWLIRQEPMLISSKIIRGLAQAAIRRWPLLVCRSPLSNTSGLILPAPPLREAALKTLIQVAQEQARRYRASFIIFDYLASYEAEETGWTDSFIPSMVPDPGTRLAITWPDFESYLAHLSEGNRSSCRRNKRHATELGIEITLHPVVTAIDEAMPLIRAVELHHNSPPSPWMRGMLENAGMVDSMWVTAEVNRRLVGCELMLGDKNTWMVTALGLDYSVRYAYFLLNYTNTDYAIKTGIKVLRWGSGAYDFKQRMGFELEDNNYLVFTTNNPALRRLGRWLAAR